jgi:cardiolipin synthase
MSSSLKLLSPTEYVKDATKHVKNARTRVSFLALIVANEQKTNSLIDALLETSRNGIKVEIAADVFTYGDIGGALPTRRRYRQSRLITKMSHEFKDNGIKFNWLGRSSSLIYSGRTHTKWCIVDDVVYSFGGVNLSNDHIENYDYMIKIKDNELADKLVNEQHRLVRADSGGYAYPSHSFEHGNNTVLIDGGLFGDSIIYRRACKLASEAKRVTFVSQYCPTGKLSRILKRTNSKLYFNSSSNAKGISKFAIWAAKLLTQNISLYKKPRYLHAKLMICYMPDGRRVALTGSHNLSNIGMLLGTREIALETEDQNIIDQLEDFVKDISK